MDADAVQEAAHLTKVGDYRRLAHLELQELVSSGIDRSDRVHVVRANTSK